MNGSGIKSIDEVVTTFIKAEDQNYSLIDFVNKLNQDTDAYEESNKQLDQQIAIYRKMAEENEKRKQLKKENMQTYLQSLRDEISEANRTCSDVDDEFKNIQDKVREMVILFKKAKFESAVAQPMAYDDSTQFNENNVTAYLAELEEYISNLITYMAYKKDDPNPAISTVAFEKLNNKVFDKKEI